MHAKLATKISVAIVGVVALAISGSLVALLSTWHIRGIMQNTVEENISSLRAAEELEIVLLEKRSLLVSFILGNGKPEYLEKFQRMEQAFHNALNRARNTAHTSSEKRILCSLEEAYREYCKMRAEMITIYQSGKKGEAIAIFLGEMGSHFQQIDRLSKDFIAENKRYIDSTTAFVKHRIIHISWLVAGFTSLTSGLGVLLAWLFFHGVLNPLRQMVVDARNFTGHQSVASAESSTEELPAIGAYLHSLMHDVSDARSALEQNRSRLINVEKLATVGKLAAGVAHEIRNPMTAIKMWLFSIRKTVGHNPGLDRKFEIISEELVRLERIVRNFLEFSRPPLLKLEKQSVSTLIDKTLELFSHQIEKKKLRFVLDDADRLPPVMADADQFKQVLINLVDNAVEATNENGKIHIAIDTDYQADDHPMVVVRVHDTGRGMPQDVQEQIFEPFFTTKEDGTGLGLCIAAKIMAEHDGRLVLESSTQQGTTFAIWIPIAQKETDEQNLGS